jgi:hypothetical protein
MTAALLLLSTCILLLMLSLVTYLGWLRAPMF